MSTKNRNEPQPVNLSAPERMASRRIGSLSQATRSWKGTVYEELVITKRKTLLLVLLLLLLAVVERLPSRKPRNYHETTKS